jgi:hypothetical protein
MERHKRDLNEAQIFDHYLGKRSGSKKNYTKNIIKLKEKYHLFNISKEYFKLMMLKIFCSQKQK